MRYKALPLAVRASTVGGRSPQSPRRSRLADWLATIPILVLVPALVVPQIPISAADPYLEVTGPAIAGEAVRMTGAQFPVRTWIRLTWDGSDNELGTVKTGNSGTFSSSVVLPSAGQHAIGASEITKGNGKKSSDATEALATIAIDVSEPAASTPVPDPPASGADPTPEPAASASSPPAPTPKAPTADPTTSASPIVSTPPTATPISTPTPTPGLDPTPTPVGSVIPPLVPSSRGDIWMGVHEDIADYWTDPARFHGLLDEVLGDGYDSISFGNGRLKDNLPLAAIADQRDFPYITSWFQADLAEQWWPDNVPADIDTARRVIGPMLDELGRYRSFIGYNLQDDARAYYNTKYRLAEQVIRERDPFRRPSSPMIQSGQQGDDVYRGTGGDAFLFYSYPARVLTAPCSWTDSWVSEIRTTTKSAPVGVPVWQLLQAHSTQEGPTDQVDHHLRYPTLEEMRLQVWIALGEGAKGLWWFEWGDWWGDRPDWTGLRRNTTLRPEASALARRVNTLEGVLQPLVKLPDEFSMAGGYVSTMAAGSRTYLIAVNTSCGPRDLTIGPSRYLRDAETGITFSPGQPIPFRGGDGRLLEVLSG